MAFVFHAQDGILAIPDIFKAAGRKDRKGKDFAQLFLGFCFLKGSIHKTAHHIIGQHLVTLPHLAFTEIVKFCLHLESPMPF